MARLDLRKLALAHVLAAYGLLAAGCATPEGAPVATRATAPPREYAQRQLNAAERAIDEKDYETALAELSKALDSGRLNALERALAIRSKGYVYTQQRRYPEAVAAYEQALALQALPENETASCEFNLGQLYLAEKRFDDALRVLTPLAPRAGALTPEVEMAQANAYWGKKEVATALPLAQSAVAKRTDAPETWLRVLASLYLEAGQYEAAARVLDDGLAAGRIEPTARTLDALTTAWRRAGQPQKAEPALRRAAAITADGRADLRLGQLLVEAKQWSPAIEALEAAQRKGGLERPALAKLLLGIAYFESGDDAAARATLSEAAASDETRAEAREYLEALDARSTRARP
jgi:tetratricopeptide (TPR) repeat protein